MSTWIKITNEEDVELSEDGETVDVLYNHDHNGNNYIEIPIEFIVRLIMRYTSEEVADKLDMFFDIDEAREWFRENGHKKEVDNGSSI